MAIDLNLGDRISAELSRQERQNAKYIEETAQLFGILVKHPAFERLVEMLNRRIELMGMELLEPIKELGQTYTQEHKKGAMMGLILARDLPQTTLQAQKQISGDGEDDNE